MCVCVCVCVNQYMNLRGLQQITIVYKFKISRFNRNIQRVYKRFQASIQRVYKRFQASIQRVYKLVREIARFTEIPYLTFHCLTCG